jgi:UDP-N-acetylmuramate-alanine ligase
MGSRELAVKHLAGTLRQGDLLLTLGAGDVWKLGEAVLEELRK